MRAFVMRHWHVWTSEIGRSTGGKRVKSMLFLFISVERSAALFHFDIFDTCKMLTTADVSDPPVHCADCLWWLVCRQQFLITISCLAKITFVWQVNWTYMDPEVKLHAFYTSKLEGSDCLTSLTGFQSHSFCPSLHPLYGRVFVGFRVAVNSVQTREYTQTHVLCKSIVRDMVSDETWNCKPCSLCCDVNMLLQLPVKCPFSSPLVLATISASWLVMKFY
jgi:hypothetical protein